MRTLFVVFLALLTTTPSTIAQTPESATPAVIEAPNALRTVWNDPAARLLDPSGNETQFALVSMTLFEENEQVVFKAEIRNTGNAAMTAPDLDVEARREGASFGVESITPERRYIPAGESGFYQWPFLFGGSLLLGDWDELTLTVVPDTTGLDWSTDDIRVEDGLVFNDGNVQITSLHFYSIIRDGDGVYIGSCFDSIGAEIPPGLSVRAPRIIESGGDSCGNAITAEAIASALNTSPISIDGYFLVKWAF